MDLVMQYIKATTTLYGVVPMQKIIEIYNEQNGDGITLDNLKDYCFQPCVTAEVVLKEQE